MTQPTKPKSVQLNIELPADLEAIYANLTLISHSPSEIIVDFARQMPNKPKAKIHARIVMTPINAKLFHRALTENIKKFEEKFGEIKLPEANILLDRNQGFTQ